MQTRRTILVTAASMATGHAAIAAGTSKPKLSKENAMSKPEFFITPGYGKTMRDALHYSQAVKIGSRVETSGQGGWNDELQIPESLVDEIAQAFRNVEKTLATAGAGWEHVIHVNSYHVGGFPPEINEAMAKMYRKYMPNHSPIWTESGVTALGLPAMRIEIRVTAIIS